MREMLHDNQRNKYPQPAVIFPGVADGVVMGGDDNGARGGISRTISPDDVSDRVDFHREPGIRHECGEFTSNGAVGWR